MRTFSTNTPNQSTTNTDKIIASNLLRYEKGLELLKEADTHLMEENYPRAESLYALCISTFTSFLEFKYQNIEDEEMIHHRSKLLLDPTIGLAFALHCNGKLLEAQQAYEEAFEWMKDDPKQQEAYGRNLLNYAELLCHLEKPVSAIESCNEALKIIEKQNGKGELYASGLSNLSIYLGIQKKFSEAIPIAKEAVELFSKAIGRNNGYTDGALEVYLRLLRDNGQNDLADSVAQEWTEIRKQAELPHPGKLAEDVQEQLTESLKSFTQKKPFDPSGAFTTPEILEEEKRQFTENIEKSGIVTPDFMKSIEAEIAGLYDLIGKNPTELDENTKIEKQIASIDLGKYYKE